VPEGYAVAGKTGTAQKPNGSGGYSNDNFTAVFAGAVPAQAPELVIVVVLDEPESSIYGGSTAAPIFWAVAAAALPVLGVAPTIERFNEEGEGHVMQARVNQTTSLRDMHSLYGLSLREVRRIALAKDVKLQVHGNGWVTRSDPAGLQGL